MSIITLDFETYYDSKIKLGFKHQTTEEYIRDKRFEVIGVGVKVDDHPAEWFSGEHEIIKSRLTTLFDWENSALLCHNTAFDGAILAWRFGIVPHIYLDTLCMARAVHGVEAGGSLASLALRYGIGEKGTEVVQAEGVKRIDFTTDGLAQYGDYCKNDVDLTHKLFNILSPQFPMSELKLIDITVRMFTTPVLELDDVMLTERLTELQAEKHSLLGSLKKTLGVETEEEVRKKLASNKQFAQVLTDLGVQPPMKTSKTTGKETFALAKNDEGFILLTEHEDPVIQELCAVRLGTKSTIEESRIERFLDVGKRNKGRLPIPLKYYGAHTGRWAGSDKVNFQNLPSRDKKKKALKNAVVAPDEHYVINCDSSQIEARVLAWLAGQTDVVEQFARGDDVYSLFATKIYDREISKKDPVERFVGKTCILGLGYGTGALKLQHTLKTQPPCAIVTEAEAKEYVRIYREENDKIIKLWSECDRALSHIADGKKDGIWLGKHKCLRVTKEGIQLPNDLYIRYPDLKWDTTEAKGRHVYKSRKGAVDIWGGSVVENVVQALARIIVGEQMIAINEKYPVVLTVHDAAVCVVHEQEIDQAMGFITKIMSTPPDWATGLPVACEANYARSYGDC